MAKPMDVETLAILKQNGFSDSYIARAWNVPEKELYDLRHANGIVPVYKMVDTCAGEFTSATRVLLLDV